MQPCLAPISNPLGKSPHLTPGHAPAVHTPSSPDRANTGEPRDCFSPDADVLGTHINCSHPQSPVDYSHLPTFIGSPPPGGWLPVFDRTMTSTLVLLFRALSNSHQLVRVRVGKSRDRSRERRTPLGVSVIEFFVWQQAQTSPCSEEQ